MSQPIYKVCAAFDTETSNLLIENEHKAICILYIVSDIRTMSVHRYEPDCSQEHVYFFREQNQMLSYIDDLIVFGYENGITPVICAYNLMFDLQTLIFELNKKYKMSVNAQSGSKVYTLDILDAENNIALRFWDTYHLEMNGLAAMGNTCGFAKAAGDWNYSLVRTKNTPLTELELGYAKRDVQVILAYLRFILESNEFLKPTDLACSVITKTSLVRKMAKEDIGGLTFENSKGEKITLEQAYYTNCTQNHPITFGQYALRRAAFRGGLTFTAARYASCVVENVVSLDVVSMHHAFINGRKVPDMFVRKTPAILERYINEILKTPLDKVLKNYEQPFYFMLHAKIRLANIRLKKDTVFEKMGVGILAEAKFKKSYVLDFAENESSKFNEESLKMSGYLDRAYNGVFAFGKLMTAEICEIFINEIELYALSMVYEWDTLEVIYGEGTLKARRPPDYVTLQSNILYRQKNELKKITKEYKGEPYTVPSNYTIPVGIKEGLLSGSISTEFLNAYYNSTVKGKFNGIYGVQAQDEYKPPFLILNGEIFVDKENKITLENWKEKRKKRSKVLYIYGMRIVGGSRLHLVIAMHLVYEKFKNGVKIVGGDTDSLKIALDNRITNKMLIDCLKPLHNAVDNAVDNLMKPVKRDYPDLAADFEMLGHFEIENEQPYDYHMEAWNKARISYDGDIHLTCAGISRPKARYNVLDWVLEYMNEHTFEDAAKTVLGYNTVIDASVSNSLQRTYPLPSARVCGKITDYTGKTYDIDEPEAVCLYEADREIADTLKRSNRANLDYMKTVYNRDIDASVKRIIRGGLIYE